MLRSSLQISIGCCISSCPTWAQTFYQAILHNLAEFAQVTYNNGIQISRGNMRGLPDNPDQQLSLYPGEYVTEVFGSTRDTVSSLGFKTSQGRVIGPWGSSEGTPFAVAGQATGFYGGLAAGDLVCIGLYTQQSARVQGPLKGAPLWSAGVTTWDDGPGFTGAPSIAFLTSVVLFLSFF